MSQEKPPSKQEPKPVNPGRWRIPVDTEDKRTDLRQLLCRQMANPKECVGLYYVPDQSKS